MTSTGGASDTVLAINVGSSSVKSALFEQTAAAINPVFELEREPAEAHEALKDVRDWLARHPRRRLRAVGHRIVHGGLRHWRPSRITSGLVRDLQAVGTVDPEHLPVALRWVALAKSTFARLPQIACFDTAFHRSMPRVARIYPLPRGLTARGVIRYGFHGLSCESIVDQLKQEDPVAATGRIVIAHLGNGASMTAVSGGCSIETTMGFSPTSGLMMGTRCGDVDPVLLLYLLQHDRMPAKEVARLVSLESGLLGASGISADVQILLSREKTNRRAREALDLFCHTARKYLGGLCAVLGGIDMLVFTGGIGEHGAVIRQRICGGLAGMGIAVDQSRNKTNAGIISPNTARASVRVMHSDENRVIARHVFRFLGRAPRSR